MLWGFFLIHSISYRHFRWEFQPKESSLDLFPEAHKQTGPCAAQGGLASQAAGMPAQAQAQATCPPPLLAMPRRPAMPLWLPLLLLLANGGLCNNSGGTLLPIKACPASCSDLAEPVICGIKDDFARTSDVAQTTRLFFDMNWILAL